MLRFRSMFLSQYLSCTSLCRSLSFGITNHFIHTQIFDTTHFYMYVHEYVFLETSNLATLHFLENTTYTTSCSLLGNLLQLYSYECICICALNAFKCMLINVAAQARECSSTQGIWLRLLWNPAVWKYSEISYDTISHMTKGNKNYNPLQSII